jgi:hypothetical protein
LHESHYRLSQSSLPNQYRGVAAPFPELSEEMARTTQRLKAEYGDISRGAGDQQGIAAAVIAYLKSHSISTYRDIKYICFGVSSPTAHH